MRCPRLFALLGLPACSNDYGVTRLQDAPDVVITSPVPGAILRQGGDILFEGTATDSYDGPASLLAWWTVDGVEAATLVGSGGVVSLTLAADELTVGPHTIGLGARDTDGDEGYVELEWLLIGAVGTPVATITAPDDGATVLFGDDVLFRGTGADAATPADDLVFSWSSSLDGELVGAVSSDGESILLVDALAEGTHLVTLRVVDTEGESATDVVTVIVGGAEPEIPVEAEVGDLVFSEIAVNPEVVDDEIGEWVELYNTSGSTIDLLGYAFHDLDFDRFVLPSVIIPAYSYAVLCANMDLATNGGVPCDGKFLRTQYGGYGTMALGNSGDEVVLSRPDGTIIDQVVYEGTWFTPGVATGLDPTVLDSANNDDETMWCDQTSIIAGATEPGTPGLPNDPCP